jgi:hypothetical protein
MIKSGIGAFIFAGIFIAIIAFVVVLLLLKLMWAWTVPDLFPGAVDAGLVANHISWFTAAKLAAFVAILSAFTANKRSRK